MSLIFIGLGALYVYFFPAILAFILRHHDARAILFVNFMIGWSILGWLILFIWTFNLSGGGGGH